MSYKSIRGFERDRIRLALPSIDAVIVQAHARGDLRFFNQAFRQWRAAGGRGLTYRMARQRLCNAIARRVAAGGMLGRDILDEVFP